MEPTAFSYKTKPEITAFSDKALFHIDLPSHPPDSVAKVVD